MVSRKARKYAYRIYRELTKMLYSDVPVEYKIEYLKLVRKISLKTRARLPSTLKLFYCKKCKSPLLPGVNAIYRLVSRPYKHIAIICLECGYKYRKGYETKD